MDKPEYALPEIIEELTRVKSVFWDSNAFPIAYTFWENLPEEELPFAADWNFAPFNAAQQQAATRAFGLFSDAANLSFVEVADNGHRGSPFGPQDFKIQFANSVRDNPDVWASTSTSGFGNETGSWTYEAVVAVYGASISADYGLGTSNNEALMHEIGHALGLQHPGQYDIFATFENDAEFSTDSRQYSIMSFFGEVATGADFLGSGASTPLLYDIAALQAVYGPNMATRTGDTIYGFNANAGGQIFDFAINNQPVLSIWDAGGEDTLDASGFNVPQLLSLQAGTFSNIGGLTANVSIAFGVQIENAIGGSGDDAISGNSLANYLLGNEGSDQLSGNGGNDTLGGGQGDDFIDGGAGVNVAQYSGVSADYTITEQANGTFIITDNNAADGLDEGSDTLSNISFLFFAGDGLTIELSATGNLPPVADAARSVTTLTNTALVFDIAASDPDGDALSFSASTPANGAVSLVGGRVTYTPATGFTGSETITVTIDDGNGGTATQDVTITTQNLPASNQFVMFTADGFAGGAGGSGAVNGSDGFQQIAVIDVPGAIALDPSFNKGGDVLQLSGDASAWFVTRSGSSALFSDGDTFVTVPVGTAGLAVQFDDGVRELVFNGSSFAIGGQTFGIGMLAQITAASDGTSLPDGADPSAKAVLFIAADAGIAASGVVDIFGAAGDELARLVSGNLTLDASFNKGGDTIAFDEAASDYFASQSGSSLRLTGSDTTALIPVGTSGATLAFGDGSDTRPLLLDTTIPAITIGGQQIGVDPVQLMAV